MEGGRRAELCFSKVLTKFLNTASILEVLRAAINKSSNSFTNFCRTQIIFCPSKSKYIKRVFRSRSTQQSKKLAAHFSIFNGLAIFAP